MADSLDWDEGWKSPTSRRTTRRSSLRSSSVAARFSLPSSCTGENSQWAQPLVSHTGKARTHNETRTRDP